jgi:hypothetical protein
LPEDQRLEQRRFIELAITGKRHQRPSSVHEMRPDPRSSPGVAEPQVILTAHKRNKRFESAVSISALREAVYHLERYGWAVVVGEEHAAPANGGRR